MSKFEVIRGVEGCCLALDDTRIAGPKPWGGGTVIHDWETDKTYMAVDVNSRWHELFGTPERAARTLVERLNVGVLEWCNNDCANCPYEFDPYECEQVLTLLEWLRGESYEA